MPTHADNLVLTMLLWDCSIAVIEQLVRSYRVGGVRNPSAARRRVRQLVASGLLGFADVMARPLLEISAPLYYWHVGSGRPNYDLIPQLAWALEARWQESLTATRVYFASRKAINVLGGVMKGGIKNYGQLSHDLTVTSIYLLYLENEPQQIRNWMNEAANVEHVPFQKVPDAIFYDLEQQPPRPVQAVEIGGFYPEAKIRAFFTDMERRQISFVIW